MRWHRAPGMLLNPEQNHTPEAILNGWQQVNDMSTAETPTGPADFNIILPKALAMPPNDVIESISLKGKVAAVTGAGAGCVLLVPKPLWQRRWPNH